MKGNSLEFAECFGFQEPEGARNFLEEMYFVKLALAIENFGASNNVH